MIALISTIITAAVVALVVGGVSLWVLERVGRSRSSHDQIDAIWVQVIIAVALGLVAGAAWFVSARPAAAHDDIYSATVESVYDGDTATVTIHLGLGHDLTNQTLRFLCINTPEIRGAEKIDGIPVRDLVREWLPIGSRVTLELRGTGKYGRRLALITPEGWSETVNTRLYRGGMARLEAYSARMEAECRMLLQ